MVHSVLFNHWPSSVIPKRIMAGRRPVIVRPAPRPAIRTLSEIQLDRRRRDLKEAQDRQRKAQKERQRAEHQRQLRQISEDRREVQRKREEAEMERNVTIAVVVAFVLLLFVVGVIIAVVAYRKRKRAKELAADTSAGASGARGMMMQQPQDVMSADANPFGMYGPQQPVSPYQPQVPHMQTFQYQPQPIFEPSSPMDHMNSMNPGGFSPSTSYGDAPPAYHPGAH